MGAVSKITTSKAAPVGRRLQEIGEAVEGGHLGRARAAHLLFHHLHHLRREGGADRRHGAVLVFLGGPVGVDFHRPQVGDAGDRRDLMPDLLLEGVGQVGCRIGGDDQRALALVGVADGVRAGHAGFAHPAFAGKEYKLIGHNCAPSKLD